jgi:hypothetical protein
MPERAASQASRQHAAIAMTLLMSNNFKAAADGPIGFGASCSSVTRAYIIAHPLPLVL